MSVLIGIDPATNIIMSLCDCSTDKEDIAERLCLAEQGFDAVTWHDRSIVDLFGKKVVIKIEEAS